MAKFIGQMKICQGKIAKNISFWRAFSQKSFHI